MFIRLSGQEAGSPARRLLIIAASLTLILCACGGKSGAKSSAPAASAFGGSGDHFLMASQAGLTESTAGGTVATLLKFDDASYILDPALSPDGKQIAFVRQQPAKQQADGKVDFGTDIYVVGRDGKNAREVAHHKVIAEFLRSPAWISNTELLIAVQGIGADGGSDFRLERLDVATGARTRVLDKIIGVAESTDLSQPILTTADPLTQEQTLAVSKADMSGVHTLVAPSNGLGFFASPVFSPDGKRIAFAAVDLNAPVLAPTATPVHSEGKSSKTTAAAALHPFAQDVWIVNTDGTGLKRLAEIAENQPSITWTADGSAVYAVGSTAFWKIDPATGKSEQVGSGLPLGQIIWLSKG